MKRFATASFATGAIVGSIFFSIIASAWSAPSGTPPTLNASTPVNLGTQSQTKNGTLGVNGLAVFGDTLHQANSYIGFGVTSGSAGYGIRDNAGVVETKNSGGSWGSIGIPSGMYAPFKGTTCPSGWLPADGTNGSADLRGQFIRGWSNGSTTDSGRVAGSYQGDAIRNITGDIGPIDGTYTGVFAVDYWIGWGATSNSHSDPVVKFDASRVVPTANEDRPVNIALLYCYKT